MLVFASKKRCPPLRLRKERVGQKAVRSRQERLNALDVQVYNQSMSIQAVIQWQPRRCFPAGRRASTRVPLSFAKKTDDNQNIFIMSYPSRALQMYSERRHCVRSIRIFRVCIAAHRQVPFNRHCRINRGARIEKSERMNWQLQYIRPNKPLSPVGYRTAPARPRGEAVLKQQLSPPRLKFSSIGRAYTEQRLVVCSHVCCSLSGIASAGLQGADR